MTLNGARGHIKRGNYYIALQMVNKSDGIASSPGDPKLTNKTR